MQKPTKNPSGIGSDHCPAMKGIETRDDWGRLFAVTPFTKRSDHCPAMKGIETMSNPPSPMIKI